jgi:uncharacterized integral membrane protein
MIMALGTALALLNGQPVRLDYYFGQLEAPLALVVAGAVAVGALFGVLASLGRVVRAKQESAHWRRRAKHGEPGRQASGRTPVKSL